MINIYDKRSYKTPRNQKMCMLKYVSIRALMNSIHKCFVYLTNYKLLRLSLFTNLFVKALNNGRGTRLVPISALLST
jgi:hypothetical protein